MQWSLVSADVFFLVYQLCATCVVCVTASRAGSEVIGRICHSRHSWQSCRRKSSTWISSPWSTKGIIWSCL